MAKVNLIDPVLGKGSYTDYGTRQTYCSFHAMFAPLKIHVWVMVNLENDVVPPSQHALYRKVENAYLAILPKIYQAVSDGMLKEEMSKFSSLEYLRDNLKLININICQAFTGQILLMFGEDSIVLRYVYAKDWPEWYVRVDKEFNVVASFLGG